MINLTIVSPEGIIFERPCSKISCFGKSGKFEILKNHEDFLAILKAEKIIITETTNKNTILLLDESILKFERNKNTCKIITRSAQNKN